MSANVENMLAAAEDVRLVQRLRAAGLRPTKQRLAIAGLLLDGRHRHVSADSLAHEIRDAGMQMAGGTVYNTLNQFTDAGLLRRVTVHNEHSVFDTNTSHHHHFYDADTCLLYTSPSPRDGLLSRMPSSA